MGLRVPIDRNDERRELLLLSTLNGIDALEVLDSDAPAGTPRQRTLVVELFRAVPTGFSADNVRLSGGVRITGIPVAWAYGAIALETSGQVPTGVVPAAEHATLVAWLQARYPAAADRAKVLVVRTGTGTHDWEGDLSTYHLRLAAGAADERVPPGFDLKFSSIDFRFKVECPRDYDCAAEAPCPPEALPAPRIDYLAKDYASFRRLMLDRLAVVMPGWGERHAADVGVTLVEALAYVADHLSYYQDAVATEAYLGTARRRVSVRRHARLLDYHMHDGCNARAFVTIDSGPPDGVVLPAGTALCTRQDRAGLLVDPARLQDATQVFETLHDVTLREAHGRISFYTWGSWRWFLPKGATQATLDATGAPLALQPGDVLVLEELLGPDGTANSADVRRRQAVRLTSVSDPGHDALTNADFVEVAWDARDALRFPLCVRDVVNEQRTPDMSVARGNVALVDAGERVADDPPLPPPSGDLPYRPTLRQVGITCRVAYDDAAARAQPAAQALLQDAREALPVVALAGPGGPWQIARDLLGSGPLDPTFVVEQEEDGTAQLRFGDGVHGKPPPPGAALGPVYRAGNGPAGNVGAEAIAHLLAGGAADLTTVRAVRNPLPAAGGTDPETIEEVRQYAPQAFRTQERAVTEADYAAAAQTVVGVRKAVARRRWTGSWYTVFLSIDREGGAAVDPAFAGQVRDTVERFRLAGEDVEVEGPVHVPLDVVLEVCVASGYYRSDVKGALADVFTSGVRAGGDLGFFHPDRYTFGQPVYLSQVVAAAMAVPGVSWVDLSDASRGQRFQRFGRPAAGEVGQGFVAIGPLEIARADSSPDFPENGRVDFILEGGL
jgi:Baseplate J-like protein